MHQSESIKIKLISIINKDEYSWLILLYARVNENQSVDFAFTEATHIFFSAKKCELDIVLTRTVNILTTNELVKLTMLWSTGPRFAKEKSRYPGKPQLQTLRNHAYLNILRILPTKNENFQTKNSGSFIRFEAVLTSTYNLCFWADIRNLMYTPVNPRFTV